MRCHRQAVQGLAGYRQLWQCRAGAKPFTFRLTAAPSRPSACAQILVVDSAGAAAMRAAAAGSGGAGRLLGACRRERGLAQRDAADRLPAEEAVDPLQDHRRLMLDFDRRRTFDAQHQRGRLAGPSSPSTARGQLILIGSLWAAISAPDDVGPARDDSVEAKPCRRERVAQGGAGQFRQRPWKTARGLVHEGVLPPRSAA